MKTNTKLIFSFIGGATIGSLICFALLKDKLDAEMKEEISEMQKYYEKEKDEMDEDHFKEMQKLVGELDTDERQQAQYVDYVKKYSSPSGEAKAYISSVKNSEEVEEDDFIDNKVLNMTDEEIEEFMEWDDEYAHPEDDPAEEPYTITPEEFELTKQHYDKCTISWYTEDETLADEREEIIPDIERVVGIDNLQKFGVISKDPNVVFVRNEMLGSDYEILLCPEAYCESVLGIPLKRKPGEK